MGEHDYYQGWALPDGSALASDIDEARVSAGINFYREGSSERTWHLAIAQNEGLTKLVVRGTCNQPTIEVIAKCPKLTHLHIDQGRRLRLGALAQLHDLRVFAFNGSVVSLKEAFSLPVIEDLWLGISDAEMDFSTLLTTMWPRLRVLSLFGSGFVSRQTVTGLEGLARLRHLETLVLGRPAKGSDFALGKLSSAPSLRKIEIHSRQAWPAEELGRLSEVGVSIATY